ncbi:hypothetical protein NPIL_51111, partial [Nephila pilipes]
IKSTIKEDLGCSSVEFVKGIALAELGEFFSTVPHIKMSEVSQTPQKIIRDMKPRPTITHGKRTVFVSKQLSNCSHIFVYNNVINSSL